MVWSVMTGSGRTSAKMVPPFSQQTSFPFLSSFPSHKVVSSSHEWQASPMVEGRLAQEEGWFLGEEEEETRITASTSIFHWKCLHTVSQHLFLTCHGQLCLVLREWRRGRRKKQRRGEAPLPSADGRREEGSLQYVTLSMV